MTVSMQGSYNVFPSDMRWPGSRSLEAPMTVMADSYKAAHPSMFPPAEYMTAYGEFREKFENMNDSRIVVYGIRHYIEQFISRHIDPNEIDASIKFFETHGMMKSKYPYPEKIFEKMKRTGHLPVKIEALPEGSVVYPHTPVYIITTKGEDSHFCTFLETILTMIWYPSTVATLSRMTKELISKYFETSVDPDCYPLLDSRLHDFGFRGCTCVEQSVIGGCAHLLSFDGSDTMSACFHAQFHLNGGIPIGESIPATEHSVMTSWGSEIEAIKNLIQNNTGKFVACVMDSYDYDNALNTILPAIQEDVCKAGVTLVLRPDSGDPVTQVTKALKAAKDANFPCERNNKGFWVLRNVAVIQGDGIRYETIKNILDEVIKLEFSAQNVAFGMGGGLLQKVNRDTMSFATKLSYIKYADGYTIPDRSAMPDNDTPPPNSVIPTKTELNVMKNPITASGKKSIPGEIMVLKAKVDNSGLNFGPHRVYTKTRALELLKAGTHAKSMITVYDNGNEISSSAIGKTLYPECYSFENFGKVRERLNTEWNTHNLASDWSPLDESITQLQAACSANIRKMIRYMKRQGTTVEPNGRLRSALYISLNQINRAVAKLN